MKYRTEEGSNNWVPCFQKGGKIICQGISVNIIKSVEFKHRFLLTLDATFSIHWGENRKCLSML